MILKDRIIYSTVVKVDCKRLEASNIAYSRYENRLEISKVKRRCMANKKFKILKIARSADTSLVSRERSPFESKRGYNQESPAANGSKT